MNKNGRIQRSNIITYELVFKSAKKLIFYLHAQHPLAIIQLGFKCLKMVAFNALTSEHINSH